MFIVFQKKIKLHNTKYTEKSYKKKRKLVGYVKNSLNIAKIIFLFLEVVKNI